MEALIEDSISKVEVALFAEWWNEVENKSQSGKIRLAKENAEKQMEIVRKKELEKNTKLLFDENQNLQARLDIQNCEIKQIEKTTNKIKNEDCSDSDEEKCFEQIKNKVPGVISNIKGAQE